MAGETDLSGEADPEERMTEQDAQLVENVEERLDNERKSEFEGEMTTDSFDVDEALSNLSDDESEL